MKNEKDEVTFEQAVRHNVLPVKGFDKFIPLDTTPSVLNLETWVANNTAPTTITDFKNGANEQRIKILGDGFTTVANNANIKTSTGVALLLSPNLIYVFTHINGIWYEDAGSGGGGGVGPTGPSGKDGLNFFPRDGKDGKDSLIPGPLGKTGNTGNTGSQGIQGQPSIVLDGKEGKLGFPGPPGKDGKDGIVGKDGINGISFIARDGKSGIDGFPGKDGKQGIQGIQGSPAIVLDGKQGPMGFPIPGRDGKDGINGTIGRDGLTIFPIDGKEGRWGLPGPKGDKGDIGLTGPAGSGGGGGSQLFLPLPGLTKGIDGFSLPSQGIKVSSLPAGTFGLTTEFPVNNAGVSQKITGAELARWTGDTIQNASSAAQAITAATLTYIVGSALAVPVGKLRIGTQFIWWLDLTKSAAGAAARTFHIRVGTAGSTADAAIISFTSALGTGVVDQGWVKILATIRGPLTTLCIMRAMLEFDHELPATGFMTVKSEVLGVTSAGFDVTVANLIVGLSVTSGASEVITAQQVRAEAKNL